MSARRLTLVLVGLFAAALMPERGAAQESIGFVYRVRGDWRVSGAQEALAAGQGVAGGDRVVAPAGDGALLIFWFPGGRVECSTGNGVGCVTPHGAAECVEATTRTIDVGRCVEHLREARHPGVFAAVARWFQEEPRRYVPLISRDFGFPAEAVVPINEGAADLTRAFESAPANQYRMCMSRVETLDSTESRCRHRLNFTWTPGERVFSPAGVTPGLYRLKSIPDDGREAWVLAVPGDEAAALRAALEEARAATDDLGLAEQSERRTFERAFMMHLAAQQGIL